MKSLPSGCAAALPSTPIIQHVAGWDSLYYNFGVRHPGLLVVRGWRYFTLFQRVAPLEGVTKLNTLVPDVWLFPCQRIIGPFDEHFDYILKLNHGVFCASQGLAYCRNLIVTISDEAGDKLEDPDAQSGFALRTLLQEVVYLRKFKVRT